MWSSALSPRRPSALLRYLLPAILLVLCLYYLSSTPITFESDTPEQPPSTAEEGHDAIPHEMAPVTDDKTYNRPEPATSTAPAHSESTPPPTGPHPIDKLVESAEAEFSKLLSRESHSLNDAAKAYRDRRGRHPPPGFDKWFEFAKEHKAVIVEDFWDQVYHDLEPFWAVPADLIRKEARDFEMTINVRNGVASAGSDWFWTKIWLNLTKTLEHILPDMDLALNAMDEPRLVVPWEQINDYMTEAGKTRVLTDPSAVVTEFQKLPALGNNDDTQAHTVDKEWEQTRPFWTVARRGCPPDSPTRKAGVMADFDHTPVISTDLSSPHMTHGYVSNYTMSTLFCHQPDLQGLNGIFVAPLSVKSTKVLFPLFGGSKLAVNNEILLPAPMYWNEEERFTGGNDHGIPWADKRNEVIWRGVATGGRNSATNWRAFQRHRFVAMNNGTKLQRAQDWTEAPADFALPGSTYGLKSQADGKLGEWVDSWANVSFTDLFCPEEEGVPCNYAEEYFSTSKGLKMRDQFNSKYLPDLDGNSFSGRYLGFLRSTSLPIKSTVWREWHDSRLIAWKHFVPMDNRYSDWYGIMEYFLGYGTEAPGHDLVAERIATAGKEWAEKVLRKEDMQVYVLRLLLEYARICDERRASMGWVDDLKASTKSP